MKITLPSEITSHFSNYADHVVKNLLITTEGIFSAKNTNLFEVKDELGNILQNQETTKPESNYKRLLRFFQMAPEQQEELSRSLLCVGFLLLGSTSGTPRYLTLDGTSWEFGQKKIHLLTLAVVVNGVSVPICWQDLEKKGVSDFSERKALLDKACQWYDLKGMVLLADREYVGREWFGYLKGKGLEFVIRLRKGVYKQHVDQQTEGALPGFKHQKHRYTSLEKQARKPKYRNVGVAKQIELSGEDYTYVVFKNPKPGAKEELLYFISTLKDKKKVIALYPIRWTIECCFKHLKSNGFNLENVNFKKTAKVKMMMSIVTFLYTLCIYQGLIEYKKKKKSDFKLFANGTRTLAISVFRKGKAAIAGKFYHLASFINFLCQNLKDKKMDSWVHVQ